MGKLTLSFSFDNTQHEICIPTAPPAEDALGSNGYQRIARSEKAAENFSWPIERVTKWEFSVFIEKITIIGDRACKYNARSPYIRCAINPCGPCDGCLQKELF